MLLIIIDKGIIWIFNLFLRFFFIVYEEFVMILMFVINLLFFF